MTLGELLEGIEIVAARGTLEMSVQGLAYDSRRVRPGDVFFALSGSKQDGRGFAREAQAAGAVAIVGSGLDAAGDGVVSVSEPRRALAQASARFHGYPARTLRIAGVTGTNGKTTTTWMLTSIFRAAGVSPGLIGTIAYRIGDESRAAPFTTPEAPELQALLREMNDRGVRMVAMEVSSHALVQRRAYGVEFDAVVFTNLTQDHLDYHGDMEHYLDAKLMLFDGRNGPSTKRATAIVWVDDPAGRRVVAAAEQAGLRVVTVGSELTSGPQASRLDVSVGRIESRPDGLALQLFVDLRGTRMGETLVRLPLLGRFNAANAALAVATAAVLGIDVRTIVRSLEAMSGVPGRLERVEAGQPWLVVVDYAHTPDALERALAAVREHVRGRVSLVFGCGGDRDSGKRPQMGRIAARDADRAWVTNDNPRGEDPAAIARAIMAGDETGRLVLQLDRRAAIAESLAAARPGDAVLIAGKGHETTQTIGDRVLPFDDRAVARELLAARGTGSP